MILNAFFAALGQIGDPRFRGVLLKGLGLTIGLLVAITWIVTWAVAWFVPDAITLPLIGTVTWIDNALSGLSFLAVLLASIFLMVPVASSVTGLFLDDVADAVEAEHYPTLPQAPRLSLQQSLIDSLGFLGVLIGANALAFIAYALMPPAAPLIFLALNGYLLGREYFQLIAMRRLGRKGAKEARSRHRMTIWLAGILMTLPLTIPVINLIIPVIGAATFTHLFHRLER